MRVFLLLVFASGLVGAERINHEGRILDDEIVVNAPLQFNTDEADDVLRRMQIMPRESAWNEDISGRPLLGNSQAQSDAMIATMKSDLAIANRQRVVVFKEMNYVLVPDSQPNLPILFRLYEDQSDLNGGSGHIGLWPIPSIMPIETWPAETGMLSLEEWQQDVNNEGGDRHSIIVKPGAKRLYETWQAKLVLGTPETDWQASNGAIFPLDSVALRPAGWTSGDAAGLPMFPALVRYDECQRGVVEHAMRIVVKRSRQSYIYPATHQAGSTTNVNVPAMGQRVRLKAGFTIPSSWSQQERAVAVALKKYGALVADNGNFFSISICPDKRWPDGCWDHFRTGASSDILSIDQFEVIETAGKDDGPRSTGAPTCDAGADQGVTIAAGAALMGSATGSGLTKLWEVYPTPTPPGTVTFGDPNEFITSAIFSAVGDYTLRLKVSDGTHTPAYDVVVITVAAGNNPVPTLTSFTPITRVQNSGAFTLTVNGSNFVPSSRVTWTGRADLLATSTTSNQLTVTVPSSYITTPGAVQVAVQNPAPGGGTTSSQTFTVTADVTAPVISAVATGSLSTSGATVTWTTNESATSQVDYGTTITYGGSTTLNAALVSSHSQSLSGLSPSTTYHYRVRSSDGAGNPATSSDGTFTTPAAPSGGGSGGGGSGGGGGCGLGAVAALLALSLLVFARR